MEHQGDLLLCHKFYDKSIKIYYFWLSLLKFIVKLVDKHNLQLEIKSIAIK